MSDWRDDALSVAMARLYAIALRPLKRLVDALTRGLE